MTDNSLQSVSADGISGMIFAMEGIRNSVVLLNGPMGCRFYHSTTSEYMMPRPPLYIPMKEGEKPVEAKSGYLNNFYFRQPRVPCTWLDSHDYVYGSEDKVREGLEYIKENVDFDILTVVNSPGASLIGDNLRQICSEVLPDENILVLESPGFSTGYFEGINTACLEFFKQMDGRLWKESAKHSDQRPRINIIGESVWHKYSEGNMREIKRLMNICGIDVGCVVFANCTLDEIKSVPSADLNLVLFPEMGKDAALWLRDRFGTPCYICREAPIGFSATEEMIKNVCDILGADPSQAFAESEDARAIAWYKINGIYSMSGRPNGTVFAVSAYPSEEDGYTSFLTDYMGMIRDKKDIGETDAELVFADGNTIAELMVKNKEFCGIEIANPSMGYTDVIPKATMGIQGSLFIIEQVLNGFMTRSI